MPLGRAWVLSTITPFYYLTKSRDTLDLLLLSSWRLWTLLSASPSLILTQPLVLIMKQLYTFEIYLDHIFHKE